MSKLSREEYLEKLISILRTNNAFADFSDEELNRFANAADFNFFEQGRRIVEQGQPGDEFFVVIDGQIRALDMKYDPPHLLNYHDTGQFIGTRALLNNELRAATLEVLVDAHLAIFDKTDWDWLIRRQPRMRQYFMSTEGEFEQRSKIDFSGRQWDEVIVDSTKRHVLVFIAKLSYPLAVLIIPVILLLIFNLLGFDFFSDSRTDQILEILTILPFVLLAGFLLVYHYIDWRNDDFILTTKRFIHIERRLFYGEQRDEAPLTRIQDVWTAYPYFFDKFDFYYLRIKTAGAGDISVKGISKARELRDQIFREKERATARVRAANVYAMRQLLAQELDWQDTLEETILSIAEEEGGMTTREQPRRVPVLVRYFIPRVQDIEPGSSTITWRKHYFVLLRLTGIPLLAIAITGYLLLATVSGFTPFNQSLGIFFQLILLGLLFASIFWCLWRYDGWRRDIYQVTDTRVIDITGSSFGLGGEIRSEGNFEDIQNITYDKPNFFYSILNMGTVIIETAGTKDTFTFINVMNPSAIQQEIFNRMVRAQQREREERRDATTRDLLSMFAEYQYLLERASEQGLVFDRKK
jgi:uncharacterized membrane protein YdbT with pleckstrin-like domain